MTSSTTPARPQLIRAMNEQLLLDQIRSSGQLSRADLARSSSLSKPTVSLALSNLERAGLVRAAGVRTGVPGPAAVLYEVRPDAGFVLALDVGHEYLRGAVSDLAGTVRSAESVEAPAGDAHAVVAALVRLARGLCTDAHVTAEEITQTVIGSPGVYDPGRDALILAGALAGWEQPAVLRELRKAFGTSLMLENDVDVAALAEQAHGHGREVDSFAFVSVGTGIGMGLVLGGRLHRGAHGAAGEIGFLPIGQGADPKDARKRGSLEAAASAAGIVRAARKAGMRGTVTARRVFAAAAEGDERAVGIVRATTTLVAQAVCSVVAVADPELVVLGGGIGQAPGFCDSVTAELKRIAPVLPQVKVSALGDHAVVDGCVAAGIDRAWQLVTAALPSDAV